MKALLVLALMATHGFSAVIAKTGFITREGRTELKVKVSLHDNGNLEIVKSLRARPDMILGQKIIPMPRAIAFELEEIANHLKTVEVKSQRVKTCAQDAMDITDSLYVQEAHSHARPLTPFMRLVHTQSGCVGPRRVIPAYEQDQVMSLELTQAMVEFARVRL